MPDNPEIDRIAELAQLVRSKVLGLFAEASDTITESINALVEEAQESESETPTKLSLSIAIKWNLESNEVEVSMPVAVKRKFSRSEKLPDHSQPQLPGISRDTSVAFENSRTDEDEKRRLAAKILNLPEENPELHQAALALMDERGIDYVDALLAISKERGIRHE
jgi:hypothetical protein